MSAAESGIPSLGYLLGGYFHQDWNLDWPTALAVLDDFGRTDSLKQVLGAREGARRLLANGLSEEELTDELVAAGLEYHPPGDGMTHAEWLELIDERLSYWIDRRESPSPE